MSPAPLVSVIIPTHRRPEFLGRCIRSVLAQTFADFELIVVENGSSHEGEAIVKQLQQEEPRLRYLYEPMPDPSVARNLGIQVSQGQLIAFVDDDDEWFPTKLERQVAVFQHDESDLGLVSCLAEVVDGTGQTLGIEPSFRGPLSFATLLSEWCCVWSLSSVLVRRACFDRVGLFSLAYFCANDYDLYLRIARHYRLHLIPEPLFRYRWHDGNMSHNWRRSHREVATILRHLQPALELGVTRTMIQQTMTWDEKLHYANAVQAMEGRDYRRATRHFFTALQLNPWIGRKVPWSRFSNPLYRTLRPYAALAYCGMASLMNRSTGRQAPHAAR